MATMIHLPCGAVTIVDADRLPDVQGYSWRYRKTAKNRRYVACNVLIDGRRTSLYLHRLLLRAPAGVEVDHANGDTLDNRLGNLRLATSSQNKANVRKSRGLSAYKGVCFVPNRPSAKKWRAMLVKDGKTAFLTYSLSEKEAALSYDAAAREYFGAYAKTNFQAEM